MPKPLGVKTTTSYGFIHFKNMFLGGYNSGGQVAGQAFTLTISRLPYRKATPSCIIPKILN